MVSKTCSLNRIMFVQHSCAEANPYFNAPSYTLTLYIFVIFCLGYKMLTTTSMAYCTMWQNI